MFREIIFYETNDGKCPVQVFLDSLKPEITKNVFFVLDIVESFEFVPSKFLKKLKNTNNIWEVRAEFEGNIYRLFGFIDKGKLVILTNAYQKKSQKTDKKQIVLAEKYRHDYLKRR